MVMDRSCLLFTALLVIGCQAEVAVKSPVAPAPGVDPTAPTPMTPPFAVPDAGGRRHRAASTRPGFGAGVRRSTVQAQPASLDVLLLMDNSGSMTGKAGTRTKWQVAQESLVAFVSDGRSAGLGLGLQFFPSDRSPGERRVRLRDQGHRLVRVVLSGTVG